MSKSPPQPYDITGAILAGGTSSRMGRDKATLPVEGRPLVARVVELFTAEFPQVLVVGGPPERFASYPVTTVADLRHGKALGGILTALTISSTEHIFIAPCDLPSPDRDLLLFMCDLAKENDVVVPEVAGCYEPLFAVYGKRCIPHITQLLDSHNFCVFDFYNSVRVRKVLRHEFPRGCDPDIAFRNINTPEQYRALIERNGIRSEEISE